MSLPKRPEMFEPQPGGIRALNVGYLQKALDHERAVAKRAVEMLRALIEANDKGSSMEWVNRMVAHDREVRKVLAEIEASGWTP